MHDTSSDAAIKMEYIYIYLFWIALTMIEQISHIIKRVHDYIFIMSSLENRYSKRLNL